MNEPVTTSMASASMGNAARLQSGRDAGAQPSIRAQKKHCSSMRGTIESNSNHEAGSGL